MLATVLAAAGRAQTVREIVVLSPERDTVPAEIPVLADTGEGLNVALTQAVRVFGTSGYDELVILPADLPSVCAGDIDALVRAGRQGGFAIAPDAADVGTNALCLVSPTTFQFQFGRNSMQLHLKESRRWGLSSQILRRPGLQFDVDLPDDLQQVHELWHPRLQG
jgi:2-phospho-L-lactate guanylyltransferase